MGWIARRPTTARGFDTIQTHWHVDLLSGKAHAVPTRATAMAAGLCCCGGTAASAAQQKERISATVKILRCMCLRSGDGSPESRRAGGGSRPRSFHERHVPGPRHGNGLRVAPHRRFSVPQDHQRQGRAGYLNGVIDDTLRACANGRKDDRDRQLPLAVFAISKAASTLGDGLAPFFIDQDAHLACRCRLRPAGRQPWWRVACQGPWPPARAGCARWTGGAAGMPGAAGRGPGRHGVLGRGPGAAAHQGAA